jgi:alanyl-tRNA synthetase
VPEAGAKMIPLPKPSIDTGSGLERLSAVMQGVHNNYDIDIFKNLIHASQNAIGREAATAAEMVSHRVIADHMRSSCFLIADGVMPSNEGRGYVLRRIMRRGMRHAHILGCESPLLYKLVPALVKEMGDAYPELIQSELLLMEVLEIEETKFKQTLGRGLRLLNEETEKLSPEKALPGDVAFKLYDTFGFPLDLTEDVLKSEGRSVDVAGFQSSMDKQKAEARASWTGSGDQKQEAIWFELLDTFGSSDFLGYSTSHADGLIMAMVKDGKVVESASKDDKVAIITNQTPFYAESGGQMGDTGVFKAGKGSVAIHDTVHKLKGLTVHLGEVTVGQIATNDVVHMQIDEERRTKLRANHSATHLLHATLRHQVGTHIVQKGSLVAPDRLRFDYSHNNALTVEQIKNIELEVNARIRLNTEVRTRLMTPEVAQQTGAMALFGEKYEDEVRVVSMGGPYEKALNPEKEYSLELCGGTHVQRTGDIGVFKIISDTGIASGIRRIEALTGQAAFEYLQGAEEQLWTSAGLLKSTPGSVAEKLEALIQDKKRLEKDVKNLQQKMASGGSKGSEEVEARVVNGIKFIHRDLEGVPANDLKPIADQLKKQIGSGVVMLTSVLDGKVSVVVAVTQDLIGKLNAVDFVRIAAEALGGKGGGGRPDMAQAGGTQPEHISTAVEAVIKSL